MKSVLIVLLILHTIALSETLQYMLEDFCQNGEGFKYFVLKKGSPKFLKVEGTPDDSSESIDGLFMLVNNPTQICLSDDDVKLFEESYMKSGDAPLNNTLSLFYRVAYNKNVTIKMTAGKKVCTFSHNQTTCWTNYPCHFLGSNVDKICIDFDGKPGFKVHVGHIALKNPTVTHVSRRIRPEKKRKKQMRKKKMRKNRGKNRPIEWKNLILESRPLPKPAPPQLDFKTVDLLMRIAVFILIIDAAYSLILAIFVCF